ncbi:MAG: hypothetical protein HWD61_08815 [Parachlamydiaceae bacterium]|nr:MAG: hypothetical protein HWD61_08815 [Parachlamydiaceae bacterium]
MDLLNKRAEIIQNLDLQTRLKHLPVLNLGNRRGDSDYIDFLQPEELNFSIMKGLDCKQRPFISLKLVDPKGHLFVVTLFQRYSSDEAWKYPYDKDGWTWGSSFDGFEASFDRIRSEKDYDF